MGSPSMHKGAHKLRSKMTLTLLEKLFSGDVLATSTVTGSTQSKTVNALDNSKLMVIKSKTVSLPELILSKFF